MNWIFTITKLNTVESNYRDSPAAHNKVKSNFSAQSEKEWREADRYFLQEQHDYLHSLRWWFLYLLIKTIENGPILCLMMQWYMLVVWKRCVCVKKEKDIATYTFSSRSYYQCYWIQLGSVYDAVPFLILSQ